MAGRKIIAITERQFAVLKILWERGPCTVRELMEHLPQGDRQPYTTVLGLLQAMEKAALVTHSVEGAAHRYHPAVSEEEATGRLLKDIVRRFFAGSARDLVLGLVEAEQLSPDDLQEIEDILAGKESTSPGRKRRRTP